MLKRFTNMSLAEMGQKKLIPGWFKAFNLLLHRLITVRRIAACSPCSHTGGHEPEYPSAVKNQDQQPDVSELKYN
jgi:hypothetical protein